MLELIVTTPYDSGTKHMFTEICNVGINISLLIDGDSEAQKGS